MGKKNYNNLTVQEIIDKANIGRSTFYAHFETKDELLRAMCTDIFQHVFSQELKHEKDHDFSLGSRELEQKITHILYHLQEKRKYLKGILSSESGEIFMHYLGQYLSEMFSGHMQTPDNPTPEEYLINHVVCSFSETIRWWITAHPQFTPKEISSFFFTAMPDHIFQTD